MGMGVWLQMEDITREVTYGGENGETVTFKVDPALVAVRARRGRSLREGPVTPPEAALLDDMESVLSFPQVGVEVYRRPEQSSGAMEEVRRKLHESPATRFAGRVLVDEETGEPVVYTENLFIKFLDDKKRGQCLEVLRAEGLSVKQELPYATNAYFVAAPEGSGQEVFVIANRLLERKDVEYCNPELVRRLAQRTISPQQWHLKSTTIGGQWVNASANVEAAHTITEGEGATIAIIDTGTDIDHDEFSSPGKLVAPRDTTANDADPRPGGRDENHGTACAGVACADGRFGASGVAPRAKLMPIRMMSQLGSQEEANAFYWAAENGADVISCSWGPADGRWWKPDDPLHKAVAPLPDSTRLALDYAVSRGRGGKGCVVLFAAGNGNESVDNDGYASYERVLAVAASNDRSVRSVYSDFGNAVFCAFPSNDFEYPKENRPVPLTPGIWTTDRTGRPGYSNNDYTNSFGGTSSACPGAAGVAALVLSCNPSLSRDQVKDVLRISCEQIDPGGGKYDEQGHSRLYGYGRLDAESAVRSVGGQTRRVHGRRVHGRRVHGRRVHGRSAASDVDLGPMEAAHELLLATLLTTQAAQIQDLRERVEQLELAD
ncbi:MAG: Calcium-dependent protease precursor [uncultured Rubrobacteraceae bacterium]|uniref:Calcium-dependent protease n=1 Tax=uncultured Rubrobacteraceae bacterium TaxID=349277 RepID=A0A6J4RFN8_9ACTN|nr:MAG: Calcium-dependent protease precursor [uncultured Rubrobacteraceae bacterium]